MILKPKGSGRSKLVHAVYKARDGLLQGYVCRSMEGVYRDMKGCIVVHQDISRHIRDMEVSQGIPSYTKITSVFQGIHGYTRESWDAVG